jgi:hypothetical protein
MDFKDWISCFYSVLCFRCVPISVMKFGRKISVVKIILLKEKWLSVFIKKFEYYWVSFMIYGNIYIYSW